MANPYVFRGKELDIISGAATAVVIKALPPPKPPIRQLPLPVVLFPTLKTGG